jgi:hypothetical protein
MDLYFHIGVVVRDIHAAMDELSAAVGLSWNAPHQSRYGDFDILVSYSIEGPPFIELIQGADHSPWDTSQGPRADHIGYWSDDLAAGQAHLERAGLPLVFDGADYDRSVFKYHRSATTGLRIELLSSAGREARMRLARDPTT